MENDGSNLIVCAECGRKGVSSSAEKCPSCFKNPHPDVCKDCGNKFPSSEAISGRCSKCDAKFNAQLVEKQSGVCPCCQAPISPDMIRSGSLTIYKIIEGEFGWKCYNDKTEYLVVEGGPNQKKIGHKNSPNDIYGDSRESTMYLGECKSCGHPLEWVFCKFCGDTRFGKAELKWNFPWPYMKSRGRDSGYYYQREESSGVIRCCPNCVCLVKDLIESHKETCEQSMLKALKSNRGCGLLLAIFCAVAVSVCFIVCANWDLKVL